MPGKFLTLKFIILQRRVTHLRLWHEGLIDKLPRQQLLGQHRECCALRGKGWGQRHATVQYVFEHSPFKLYQYHMKVMDEMKKRGYHHDPLWENPAYRGKSMPAYESSVLSYERQSDPIFPEHDEEYLQECVKNLEEKGIRL